MRQNFKKSLVIGMIADNQLARHEWDTLSCDVSYENGQLEMGLKVQKPPCVSVSVEADYLNDVADKIEFAPGWEPFYMRRLKSLFDSINQDQKFGSTADRAVPCTELQAEEAFSLPSGRPEKAFAAKHVAPIFPSSPLSMKFGRSSSHSYVVQVGHWIDDTAFDSVVEAEARADESWPNCRYANHYLQNPMPGSKFCASQPSMK